MRRRLPETKKVGLKTVGAGRRCKGAGGAVVELLFKRGTAKTPWEEAGGVSQARIRCAEFPRPESEAKCAAEMPITGGDTQERRRTGLGSLQVKTGKK